MTRITLTIAAVCLAAPLLLASGSFGWAAEPFKLWTGGDIPAQTDAIPFVPSVRHQTIHRVSEPGETSLKRIWRIRDGKLWIVCSIGKEDCGLSIIDIDTLKIDSLRQA